MPSRALRRHQAISHMMRRLKEDRNQHYTDIGDVVCTIPWGGRLMTVIKKFPAGLVECAWSYDGDIEEGIFLEDELEVVE